MLEGAAGKTRFFGGAHLSAGHTQYCHVHKLLFIIIYIYSYTTDLIHINVVVFTRGQTQSKQTRCAFLFATRINTRSRIAYV